MGKLRILVADDNIDFHDLVAVVLEFTPGNQVVGNAMNGREAIECACRLKPDVVLMDYDMPDLDGFAACAHIKSWSCPPKVLIVSARLTAPCANVQAACYCDGFISKLDLLTELPWWLEIIQSQDFDQQVRVSLFQRCADCRYAAGRPKEHRHE